eukprot:jgi/Ulvmu1/9128/UM005_0224.1
MQIARTALRERLVTRFGIQPTPRGKQGAARGRMKICNAQEGEAPDSQEVVLLTTTSPEIGDWEVGLQQLGVPAQVWPAKFEPNGRCKLEDVTFAVCWKPPADLLCKCPNLKSVHSLGAGVDAILPLLPKGVALARIADPVMAERMATWVTWAVTNSHRRMDEYLAGQRDRRWMQRHLPVPDNGDYRVTVLGRGMMGLASARQLQLLGYDVCTCSRSPLTAEDEEAQHGMRNVTVDRLADVLPGTDALVCLLPLTDATRNIINAPLLASLKRGAVLINAARGEHVVEEDLLEVLDSGALSSAILDVMRQEPLPEDSPLWTHSKVRLTAHTASLTNRTTAMRLITENYRRHQAGEAMVPVVDKLTGY